MLNYSYCQSQDVIQPESGPSISIEPYVQWTADAPSDKKLVVKIRFKAVLKFQNKEWTEDWEFAWPDEGIDKLHAGFLAIRNHVDRRHAYHDGGLKREAYVDVYPWLRLGWVDLAGKWYGYILFTKENHTVTARFPNFESMVEFRHILNRAFQF